MVRILACDPGASAGFAYQVGERYGVSADADLVPADGPWAEVVIEDQHLARFIYRDGVRRRVSPKSQITLIRTAERLLLRFPAERQYRIQPDAWRAVLWPGARRLPKKTVVARLRADEPELLDGLSDDVVEARGILRAWLTLTPVQKRKYLVKP